MMLLSEKWERVNSSDLSENTVVSVVCPPEGCVVGPTLMMVANRDLGRRRNQSVNMLILIMCHFIVIAKAVKKKNTAVHITFPS